MVFLLQDWAQVWLRYLDQEEIEEVHASTGGIRIGSQPLGLRMQPISIFPGWDGHLLFSISVEQV